MHCAEQNIEEFFTKAMFIVEVTGAGAEEHNSASSSIHD